MYDPGDDAPYEPIKKPMEETFKGEAKIIERLKAEAIKASDKLIAAQLTMDAMQKRLNAFNLEMDLTTGEIKTKA